MRFRARATYSASKDLGVIEANSPEEAERIPGMLSAQGAK